MVKSQQIRNLTQLKKVLNDHEPHSFRLLLNGGAYSRKTIKLYKNGKFRVDHHIDGWIQRSVTDKQMLNPKTTNIAVGMRRGAFILVE